MKTPLTVDERQALEDVADDLGVEVVWLWALIEFESGWNPTIKNPTSSARGLIQFMNATAREMGYSSSLHLVIKNPTREKQLRGPVLDYLRDWMPYPTAQSLFMGVFLPAARFWPEDSEFPEKVQAANPGIVTVGDYVQHVWKRAGAYPQQED